MRPAKKKVSPHFTLPDPSAVYLLHSEALKLIRNVCQWLYKRKRWVVFVLLSPELLLPFPAVTLFVLSFAGTVCALSTHWQCLQVPAMIALTSNPDGCSVQWFDTNNAQNDQLQGTGAPNPYGFRSDNFPCRMINKFFICIEAFSEIAVAGLLGSTLLGH